MRVVGATEARKIKPLRSGKMEKTMVARSAEAEWNGSLSEGSGTMKFGSGAFEGQYSFKSRFENGRGTNPEELIAAAHAGCFSMALSLMLGQAGFTPRRIHTTATAHIEKAGDGFKITHIDLDTEADVPNIDESKFHEQAEAAKRGCPVSQALAGTNITLNARLLAH
jgi:osmotically inducible protein OsmC